MLLSNARYFLRVPRIWLQLTAHNTWGILNVLDIIWLRPMPGGMIDEQHPFCTGLDPATGKTIWKSNVTPTMRSSRRSETTCASRS
jgi:hypothetical protein